MGCSGSQEVPVQKRPTHATAAFAGTARNGGFHPIPDRYETIGTENCSRAHVCMQLVMQYRLTS